MYLLFIKFFFFKLLDLIFFVCWYRWIYGVDRKKFGFCGEVVIRINVFVNSINLGIYELFI